MPLAEEAHSRDNPHNEWGQKIVQEYVVVRRDGVELRMRNFRGGVGGG